MGFQEAYRSGALEMYCSGLGNLPEKICISRQILFRIDNFDAAGLLKKFLAYFVICGVGQIAGSKQPADVSLLSDTPLEEKHMGYNVTVKA